MSVPVSDRTYTIYRPDNRESILANCSPSRAPWWMYQWEAGIALTHHLQTFPQRQRILEVGCGLGLTSIVAKSLGHTVTVTDMFSEALEYLQYNASINNVESVTIYPTIQDVPSNSQEYVVAADIMYNHSMLNTTLTEMRTKVIDGGYLVIAEPIRSSPTRIRERLATVLGEPTTVNNFTVELGVDDGAPEERTARVFIYTFRIHQ